MNFFDILRSLLFAKKTAEDLCSEGLQQFTPYMVNRWISFYDNSKTIFINETFNKFASLFEDKNEMYKLYFNLIPQSKFKKINYINNLTVSGVAGSIPDLGSGGRKFKSYLTDHNYNLYLNEKK